jgi:hypothetical protein
MSRHPTRRSLIAGLGPVALCAAARPGFADDQTLTQTNAGAGTYWLPIISAFYVKVEQNDPVWPEGDGPPVFPEKVVNPPLRFALNPSPVDMAATIDTDWAELQKRFGNGEQSSGWAVARQFGQPRLWVHRTFDEEYLAGYPESQRARVYIEFDVVRQNFPLAKNLTGPARKQFIRDNVRALAGKIIVGTRNGVRKNGSGGTLDEASQTISGIGGTTLGGLQKMGLVEFVPRHETFGNGDLLDGVMSVQVEIEFEAGTELGLAAPERKKVSGEIRFAVGEAYIDIGLLSGGHKKK